MSLAFHPSSVDLALTETSTPSSPIGVIAKVRLVANIAVPQVGSRTRHTLVIFNQSIRLATWRIDGGIMDKGVGARQGQAEAKPRSLREHPALQRFAARMNPQLFAERGSAEESARDDQRLMDAFADLRRSASADH